MNPNPASPSWVGLSTAAPARLLNARGESPRYTETDNAIQFTSPTRSVEERGLSALAGDHMTQFISGRNLSRNTPLTNQDADSMFATLYGQGVSLQGSRAISTEGTPLAEQASCVVPDVLCHAGTEFRSSAAPRNAQIHPREAMQLDDVPEAAEEDSRSEPRKVEPDSPDEAAVDESSENAVIEDGLHDTDAEDSSSEGLSDEAVKLSPDRDAGSPNSPKPAIKTSPAEQESGIDPSRDVGLSEEGSVVRSLMDRGILEKVLIEIGYLKPPEPETKNQPPPVNPPAPADKDRFKCDKCPKAFPRHSELKYVIPHPSLITCPNMRLGNTGSGMQSLMRAPLQGAPKPLAARTTGSGTRPASTASPRSGGATSTLRSARARSAARRGTGESRSSPTYRRITISKIMTRSRRS